MFTTEQQNIIDQAKSIIASLYKREDLIASDPDTVSSFCLLEIGALEHEEFGVLFLDITHQLISFERMFRGTINSSSVYPREVLKKALFLNAAAVIFTHNHPSGNVSPSESDRAITSKLIDAMRVVDIRVLDHIIVSFNGSYSFADNGELA